MSLKEEASTMLRTMNRLIALSFGIAFPVDTQRTRFTCPRPCLLRPWLRRLTVMVQLQYRNKKRKKKEVRSKAAMDS